MHVDLVSQPTAAAARIKLDAGDVVRAEVGSMIAMSPGINVNTTALTRSAGILRGLRRMLAGENFFLNEFVARNDGQELIIAPKLMGDVVHHSLRGGSLIVQGHGWLASSTGVELDATWQGIGSAIFSGEGMFWVKCTGVGDVLLNSYGGIYEVNIRDTYTVDTGHIVAFEDTLKFRVGRAADSWAASILGGEGLVCKFSGEGKLYCQTHDNRRFGRLVGSQLKPREVS
jgi:uncharacterized protein (TIGR00266 family)